MSSIGDKLHNAFSRMAKESTQSAGNKNSAAAKKSPIANALGKAGDAFQLNQETEITSGFSKLFGNKPDNSFLDGLFDKIDLEGLADKVTDQVDVDGIVDDIDFDKMSPDGEGDGDPDEDENADAPNGNQQGDEQNNQAQQANSSSLSASHQEAYDKLTSIHADFQTAVTALENATNRTGRRDATDDLWTWTRSHFPGLELMQGIAQSQSLTTTQKQYELGRFAVLVLRMEYLIGWARLAGSNQNSVPTWERSSPDNLDEFYTGNDGMGGGDDDWCSRFAGYARKRLGFRTDLITRLMFNSGLRVYEWAVHDRTHDHKNWTTVLGTNSATNAGVQVIPKEDFASLVTTLASTQNAAADVNSFFNDASRFVPQAGDLCILGDSGNKWKSGSHSHTVTFEKYDTATQCAYTIEGNHGRRAAGREFDFKETDTVGEILYIIRPGIEQHQGDNNFAAVLTQAQINTLYDGMEEYLETLAAVVTAKNYFKSSDNDALVYTWYTGNTP